MAALNGVDHVLASDGRPVRRASGPGIDRLARARHSQWLGALTAWLRIPSISTSPAHDDACREAAGWIGAHLESIGCRVELLGSRTHPIVRATGPAVPGAPVVLVYGHYDVQPPDPIEAWASPPFEPVVRGTSLHARGASDDKGQVFAVACGYEAALAGGAPRVNVRFLIEGQEESGGHVLADVLAARPALADADVVLVADAAYPAPGRPAVEIGVRGICYAELRVRTLRHDLHSGLFGGAAPNAHGVLCRVLAGLRTTAGHIRIPGLYDRVRPPSPRERADWKSLPIDEDEFVRDTMGARGLADPAGPSLLERLWAQPSLDVHGIGGGFVGDGVKTVIPAEARAKVSLRLVPDQRYRTVFDQLRRAAAALTPPYADLECRLLVGADPVRLDDRQPAFRHLDEAFREVEGRGLTSIRSGGSLPIVSTLRRRGAAVLLTGIGLPDDNPHGPNEKLSLAQFATGVRVFARFFERLGRPIRARARA